MPLDSKETFVSRRVLSLITALTLSATIAPAALATDAETGVTTESACAPGRVRQDARSLTDEQKHAYVDAIHQLKATPSPWDPRYTWYDQFVRWHQLAVVLYLAADRAPIAHSNPAFPPWHRHLLWLYESALCEVSGNPDIALPYWDWTDPRSTAATFSNDLMGPSGVREQTYAVVEGPFSRDVWQLNILPFDEMVGSRRPEKHLVRGLGLDTASKYQVLLPTIVDVEKALAVDVYDRAPWNGNSNGSFRNTVEGFVIDPTTGLVDLDQMAMHNAVHDWVGGVSYLTTGTGELIRHRGTMNTPGTGLSVNDPSFFMHHANVDRLWASWQAAHPGPENYLPQGGEARCPYPEADDRGPDDPQPNNSDIRHVLTNMSLTGDGPFPGTRLDDQMYPYCLSRYEGTLVHANMSPRGQLDTNALGFSYASLYEVPEASGGLNR